MVKIHETNLSLIPNAVLIAGNAGPTIPMSRAPIKTPTNSKARILFLSELSITIVDLFHL
jgi:hypothetical protein